MRLPDLVIGGAPKCGTSSLFRWLRAHPDVCGSSVKETAFLLDRGHPMFDAECNVHDHGVASYARFFEHCSADGGQRLLEATTHYLYQRTAPEVLASFGTPVDVVFLLRKPSARVYSSYRYSRNNQASLRASVRFSDYVEMGPDAEPDRYATPGNEHILPIWRNDVGYGRYAEHLDRWAAHLPRERLHVFLFEDMQRDPRAFVMGVAERVGIDPSFYRDYDFERHNASYAVRSQGVHQLALRAARRFARLPFRSALRGAYLRLFTRRARPETDAEDRRVLAALDRMYEPHNRRLERDYDVNLGAWR